MTKFRVRLSGTIYAETFVYVEANESIDDIFDLAVDGYDPMTAVWEADVCEPDDFEATDYEVVETN